MNQRRTDAPSLAVIASGGVGVLVVVAFVVALAFGATARRTPGELVRMARAGDAVEVLAGRCLDERVTTVLVTDPDGNVLWQVSSAKGSIERRYVVGGEPPLGFTVQTPLAGPLPARVWAEVRFVRDGTTSHDARLVDVASLPGEAGLLDGGAPPCGGDDGPGALTVLFAFAAIAVLGGYLAMLLRYLRQ